MSFDSKIYYEDDTDRDSDSDYEIEQEDEKEIALRHQLQKLRIDRQNKLDKFVLYYGGEYPVALTPPTHEQLEMVFESPEHRCLIDIEMLVDRYNLPLEYIDEFRVTNCYLPLPPRLVKFDD